MNAVYVPREKRPTLVQWALAVIIVAASFAVFVGTMYLVAEVGSTFLDSLNDLN